MLLYIASSCTVLDDLEVRPRVRGMGGGELDEEPMANAESDTAEKCWQMLLMSALAVVVVRREIYAKRGGM